MTMTSARGFLVALSKTVPVKAPVPCWASTAPAPTIDRVIPTARQASHRRPPDPLALVIACRPIFRQRLLSDGPREHCLGVNLAGLEGTRTSRHKPPLPLTARRVYHWRRGIVIPKST